MHRLTRYLAGWVTATALATGVSWVAIQNLVTTAALSQPAVPVLAPVLSTSVPTATPTRPRIKVTTPAATTTRSTPKPAATRTTPRPGSRPTSTAPRSKPKPTNAPTVQGYSMNGGQVVLELRPDSVELVSAIPAAGFSTETWKTEYWIRVDFVSGDRRSSLIASWYNTEPVVQETEF